MMLAFLLPVPFLLAMLYAFFGNRKTLGYVGSAAGLATLVMTFIVSGSPGVEQVPWFSVASVQFVWTAMIDNLSLLLTGIVAGIGTFIFFYSAGYMEDHEDLRRYYAELSLFAAAMIGVVTSANLFQTFFSWELVGVSSYLLIGFWHDRESAVAAARKAFITIIIGDAFFLAGIFLLWRSYGTFDIPQLLAGAHADTITMIAGACLIIGAISKSAQFPLHTWLPDAMEGPTPVSAFLHSATMVKAGLFLVARMLPLLVIAGLSPMIILIAAITIIISACCALVENDVKRVLAYSTMNQLAFILLALGVGASVAGMYHLLNHSIFKALLFMCAGVIIHTAATQDMTKTNLKLGWNLLAISSLVGALALAGLPPFSGFFSKDAIFSGVLASGNVWLIGFFCIAIFLSSLYIFRWYFLIFRKDGMAAQSPWQMKAPLPILSFFAITGGAFMIAFYSWWSASEEMNLLAATISTVIALAGFVCAYLIYYRKSWNIETLAQSPVAALFRAKFLIDDLYDMLAGIIGDLGLVFAWIDDHFINRFIEGLTRFFSGLGAQLRRMITGSSSTYLTAFIIGFLLIALFLRFT